MSINRRTAVKTAAAFGILSSATKLGLQAEAAASKGRLNQSVCKWCYRDMSLDELAQRAAKMGIVAIDLLTEEEWPDAREVRAEVLDGQRDLLRFPTG